MLIQLQKKKKHATITNRKSTQILIGDGYTQPSCGTEAKKWHTEVLKHRQSEEKELEIVKSPTPLLPVLGSKV